MLPDRLSRGAFEITIIQRAHLDSPACEMPLQHFPQLPKFQLIVREQDKFVLASLDGAFCAFEIVTLGDFTRNVAQRIIDLAELHP